LGTLPEGEEARREGGGGGGTIVREVERGTGRMEGSEKIRYSIKRKRTMVVKKNRIGSVSANQKRGKGRKI